VKINGVVGESKGKKGNFIETKKQQEERKRQVLKENNRRFLNAFPGIAPY